MDDTTPTPDPAPNTTPTPVPTASAASDVEFLIRATHQLRRGHDGSVISNHCSGPCAADAVEHLSLAELIGPTSPGPLQRVHAEVVDLATGKAVAWTTGLTPLNGEPTDVYSWP